MKILLMILVSAGAILFFALGIATSQSYQERNTRSLQSLKFFQGKTVSKIRAEYPSDIHIYFEKEGLELKLSSEYPIYIDTIRFQDRRE